ncbi:MAG: DUF2470 domain-containing protein [Kiloniellales bacterium]|nr:DUF2470 domain-containing protein [Kiloniellales bacterium]
MTDDNAKEQPPGAIVRAIMRRATQASLATRLAPRNGDGGPEGAAGWPYASLVLVALDHDASPLLLLSDLADHARNLKADPRLSLLFDGTAGYRDPLTGPRASLLGRAERLDERRDLTARFLARHEGAAVYAGFADFHLYRVAVERAHLVAGFGRIHWVEARDILLESGSSRALAEAEARIIAHMNEDHADAIALIARNTLGLEGDGWRMTAVDPEGADLCREGQQARLNFSARVTDAQSCREALVAATKAARQADLMAESRPDLSADRSGA